MNNCIVSCVANRPATAANKFIKILKSLDKNISHILETKECTNTEILMFDGYMYEHKDDTAVVIDMNKYAISGKSGSILTLTTSDEETYIFVDSYNIRPLHEALSNIVTDINPIPSRCHMIADVRFFEYMDDVQKELNLT